MIKIRAIKQNEVEKVRKLGQETFEWFESLFVPKSKDCLVALEENSIIGAVIYKLLNVADKKIGYVDYIFVDKSYQGKGVGSKLVDACFKKMKQEDCNGYSAIVRDDNAASWKMFVNHGLKRVGLEDLIRQFGISGMFKLTFKTPMNIATGMDFYLKMENSSLSKRKENSIFQIFKYLIFLGLLLSPGFLYDLDQALHLTGAILTVLVIRIAFGYLGTIFSKEKWHFRVCDGGYIIPVIASFFNGIFLISGNWYPVDYRKEPEFKRSLGITALAQWISLFFILLISNTQLGKIKFLNTMANLSVFIMIISVIPYYPLASFGGKRIFEWNKKLYSIIVFLTLYLVLFL